jgi:hypothetical protein
MTCEAKAPHENQQAAVAFAAAAFCIRASVSGPSGPRLLARETRNAAKDSELADRLLQFAIALSRQRIAGERFNANGLALHDEPRWCA